MQDPVQAPLVNTDFVRIAAYRLNEDEGRPHWTRLIISLYISRESSRLLLLFALHSLRPHCLFPYWRICCCLSSCSNVAPSLIRQITMASPKKSVMDDSTSETLKSTNVSVNEKNVESYRKGSQSPTPEPSVKEGDEEPKVIPADATVELTKIMTSAEGVEYPTGLKLGLISLALCLSVFLIALVCTNWIPFQGRAELIRTGQYNHCDSHPQNHRVCDHFPRLLEYTSSLANMLLVSFTRCQTLDGMEAHIY